MLLAFALLAAIASAPVTTECELSLSRFFKASSPDTRVVATFTETQRALLPLDEASGPLAESTLFPVGNDRFVLTLQVHPATLTSVSLPALAKQICSVGTSAGGRFNGIMAFKRESMNRNGLTLVRERMTDAAFAALSSK